jgi:hypothetical protein
VLIYADDVPLYGDNIDFVKKIIQALTDASMEVDIKVNAEKSRYMWISSHKNAGENRDIKISNSLHPLKIRHNLNIWERL